MSGKKDILHINLVGGSSASPSRKSKKAKIAKARKKAGLVRKTQVTRKSIRSRR